MKTSLREINMRKTKTPKFKKIKPFKKVSHRRYECSNCKHYIACNFTIIGCTHFKLIDERIEDLLKEDADNGKQR